MLRDVHLKGVNGSSPGMLQFTLSHYLPVFNSQLFVLLVIQSQVPPFNALRCSVFLNSHIL